MGQTGNKPPATVPAKGKYMGKDLKRISEYFVLDIKILANSLQIFSHVLTFGRHSSRWFVARLTHYTS